MTGIIRTLTGDIDPALLGWVNYHEHLFQATPLLPGEELDDVEKSEVEAQLLHSHGIDTMIDATPVGLGRNVAASVAIARKTGLNIVHATGAHHGGHYATNHPIRECDEAGLYRLFLSEVTEGFPGLDNVARAGIIKTGIRYWQIGDFEQAVLSAACRVQREVGVPLMVHMEHGSAGFELIELLTSLGADLSRVILAHMDRNLDPWLHRELAESGVMLGYDGPARHQYASDQAIIDCAAAVAETHLDHLLLGGDVARRSRYIAYGGMPGLQYLPQRFVPRLRQRLGDEAIETIMHRNAARVLAFAPGV